MLDYIITEIERGKNKAIIMLLDEFTVDEV